MQRVIPEKRRVQTALECDREHVVARVNLLRDRGYTLEESRKHLHDEGWFVDRATLQAWIAKTPKRHP